MLEVTMLLGDVPSGSTAWTVVTTWPIGAVFWIRRGLPALPPADKVPKMGP